MLYHIWLGSPVAALGPVNTATSIRSNTNLV